MPPTILHPRIKKSIEQLRKELEGMEKKMVDLDGAYNNRQKANRPVKPADSNMNKERITREDIVKDQKMQTRSKSHDSGIYKNPVKQAKCCPCKRSSSPLAVQKDKSKEQISKKDVLCLCKHLRGKTKTTLRCSCGVQGQGDHVHHRICIPLGENCHIPKPNAASKGTEMTPKAHGDPTWADILSQRDDNSLSSKKLHSEKTKSSKGEAQNAVKEKEALKRQHDELIRVIDDLQSKLRKKDELAAWQANIFKALQKELAAVQEENDAVKLEVRLRAMTEEKLKVLLEGKEMFRQHVLPHNESLDMQIQDLIVEAKLRTGAALREQVIPTLELSVMDHSLDDDDDDVRGARGTRTTVTVSTYRSSVIEESTYGDFDDYSTSNPGPPHSSPSPSEGDEIVPLPDITDASTISPVKRNLGKSKANKLPGNVERSRRYDGGRTQKSVLSARLVRNVNERGGQSYENRRSGLSNLESNFEMPPRTILNRMPDVDSVKDDATFFSI